MPTRRLSRRGFLKVAGLAGATLTAATVGAVAMAPDPEPVALTSHTFGGSKMKNRILIAYASHAGSTLEVATAIGETLAERGFHVDVKPVREEPSLAGYDAVLVGSAVHRGHWLPEAVAFVKANKQALSSVPVGLFCVHIQNLEADEASRRARMAYLNEVRPLVRPAVEGYFAGKFDRRGAELLMPGFVARFIPTFERRNWGEIRAWAGSLQAALRLAV